MIRTFRRRGWLLASFVAASALTLGACKKDEKKDPGTPATGGTTAGDKAAGAGATAKTAGAIAAASGDDLALLPVDSELVMGLNIAQLQQSSLWKKFVEPQLMKGDAQQKLSEFKAKCGFDPLASVKSVSVGLKGIGADKPDGVFVVHGIEKAKALDCFDKMKDEAAKSGDTVTRDGEVVSIKSKDGDNVAITFVNDTTAVAVVGANATTAGVNAVAKGTSALKSSPAFVDMYSKIKTGDSLWLLMNGNSKAFDQAAKMGIKTKAVFGSINVTDGLTVDMRMRVDSPDQATQMANGFKGQAQALVSMVDKLDIGSEASDVKVFIMLSQQKLETLVQQFGGMLGAGAGGPATTPTTP